MLTNLLRIEENSNYKLIADDKSNLAIRIIDFKGVGWYSKSPDSIYRKGTFATYSRIKIQSTN